MSQNKPVRPPHSAWFVLAWAAVIAAIVSTITWWVLKPQAAADPKPPTPTATSSTAPAPKPEPVVLTRQHSLLIQVRNPDQLAVDNAIAVVGGDVQASVTTTLPGLMVNIPGDKSATLAEAGKVDDTLASVHSMTDLLGAQIDGGLTFDPLALAGLVDSVGGIVVDVQEPLLATQGDNKIVDIIPAGWQVMRGPRAMEYALTLGPGEEDRRARFSEVLNEIVLRLPDSPERTRQLITSLGSLARSTEPTDDLVDVLTALHEQAVLGKQLNAVLPVTDVNSENLVELNRPKADRLVRATMPELLLAAGEAPRIRVDVQNGTGKAELGSSAVQTLIKGGFAVIDATVTTPQAQSKVEVPNSSQIALDRGKQVAQALGLEPSAVVVTPQMPERVDAIAVLGKEDLATD